MIWINEGARVNMQRWDRMVGIYWINKSNKPVHSNDFTGMTQSSLLLELIAKYVSLAQV